MRRYRIVLAAWAAAFCAGCAVTPAPPERLAEIRTIGVVSVLGVHARIHELSENLLDILEFNNEPTRIDIAHWNLDEWIIDHVQSSLGGRFEFKEVAYDKEPFLRENAVGYVLAGARVQVEDALRTIPPADVDAYLTITERSFQEMRCTCEGVGLTEQNGLFSSDYYLAFAFFDVRLIDANDYSVIANAIPFLAFRDTDSSLWTKPLTEFTDEHNEALFGYITSLIGDSVDERMRAMALMP